MCIGTADEVCAIVDHDVDAVIGCGRLELALRDGDHAGVDFLTCATFRDFEAGC